MYQGYEFEKPTLKDTFRTNLRSYPAVMLSKRLIEDTIAWAKENGLTELAHVYEEMLEAQQREVGR
jgi:hypothetical protein